MRFLQLFFLLGAFFLAGCSLSNPKTDNANISLENCYFKLVALGSQKAKVYDNQGEPHLILGNEGNVYGSDGCNRLMGSYKIDKNRVEFSKMGTTMMSCPNGMEQAFVFTQKLEKVKSYSISGETLNFLNEDGEIILTFEAVVL